MSETEMDLGFDPDALREKYRVERDKRLRPDGNEQFKQMEGDFTRYVLGDWSQKSAIIIKCTDENIELIELI